MNASNMYHETRDMKIMFPARELIQVLLQNVCLCHDILCLIYYYINVFGYSKAVYRKGVVFKNGRQDLYGRRSFYNLQLVHGLHLKQKKFVAAKSLGTTPMLQ